MHWVLCPLTMPASWLLSSLHQGILLGRNPAWLSLCKECLFFLISLCRSWHYCASAHRFSSNS